MAVVSMKDLLEAGVHFGHRTRRWNPKMLPYIFTERSGIHIIDLQQTLQNLNEYAAMVRDIVAKGGTILFVGTKRQAQATVRQEADRCRMPYINQRWLGGTLTNWVTIKQRIDYLLQMERRVDAGEFRTLSKKEQLDIEREIEKLNKRIGGLKTLRRLPDMLFVVDINTEDLAVMEANKLRIPIIAMVDTNSNPDLVEYVIPSNDDAIRAVKLIVSVIANAVEEGMRIREVDMADTGQVSKAELAEMEQYLGPSTLAKLKATVEDFDSYEEDDSGELEIATDDSDDSDDEYDDFEYDDEDDKAVVAYSDDDDDE
ncbi:MAG: 30S ribosomal protein S2 [Caldilineaceae bacterium]|nr:30S ribosomal protein S2 [Caldilineaceae bacterium]